MYLGNAGIRFAEFCRYVVYTRYCKLMIILSPKSLLLTSGQPGQSGAHEKRRMPDRPKWDAPAWHGLWGLWSWPLQSSSSMLQSFVDWRQKLKFLLDTLDEFSMSAWRLHLDPHKLYVILFLQALANVAYKASPWGFLWCEIRDALNQGREQKKTTTATKLTDIGMSCNNSFNPSLVTHAPISSFVLLASCLDRQNCVLL